MPRDGWQFRITSTNRKLDVLFRRSGEQLELTIRCVDGEPHATMT